MRKFRAQFIDENDELRKFAITAKDMQEAVDKIKSKFPTANPIQIQIVRSR